jgi:hypothetical protein
VRVGIHITHEAVQKIGGIGSVIHGLCSTDGYKRFFRRTLLYGPLFTDGGDVTARLGKGGEVLYSSREGYDRREYGSLFAEIRGRFGVELVYGRRPLADEFDPSKQNRVEVLLVDVTRMVGAEVDRFKYRLWEEYGLKSDRFGDWDYEQYLRIAVPYISLLDRLYPEDAKFFHFAHEYMGVPSGLAALLDQGASNRRHRTFFYAHEVSPCRGVVERDPGHDIGFYANLARDQEKGATFEQTYGSQESSYRAQLVKRAALFDRVLAVSDLVKEEYLYFAPQADPERVVVTYNGIPIVSVAQEKKLAGRRLIQTAVRNLLGYTPDFIFTHVTRLVTSKALWRDITFLYFLEEILQKEKKTGVYILLSTLIGTGRDPWAVASLAQEGWPRTHREGWPDLVGAEVEIYRYLEEFNRKSSCLQGIFINQFGFSRRKCGAFVPEEAEFLDLRIGSDAEFGFSIYEPFGIAQLETLPFGGIAALSSACGSSYALKSNFPCPELYRVFDFIGRTASEEKREIPDPGREAPDAGWQALDAGRQAPDAERDPTALKRKISDPSKKPSDPERKPFGTLLTADRRFEMEKELFRREAPLFYRMLPKSDEERVKALRAARKNIEALGWERTVESMKLRSV